MSIDTKMPFIPAWHGLRGLAALAVFAVHYQQIVNFDFELGPLDSFRIFANGEYGVALFFVLSGCLLSLPYWRALGAGTAWPQWRPFAARRLVRIVPAYYFALTLLIVLDGLWRVPGGWTDILLHYGFLFNFTEFTLFSINPPFWTLAVEVQFYLLLPGLFWLVARRSVRHGLLFFMGLSLVCYGLHLWLLHAVDQVIGWPGNPALTWIRPYGGVVQHSLLAQLPVFLCGVIGAGVWVSKSQQDRPTFAASRRAEWLFWVSVLALAVLLGSQLGDWVQLANARYSWPLIPALFAIVVLSAPHAKYACRWLELAPLRGLGLVSYGFYVFHLPCLRWVDQAMQGLGWDASEHWVMLGLGSVILTLSLAIASYFIIEQPLRRWVRAASADR